MIGHPGTYIRYSRQRHAYLVAMTEGSYSDALKQLENNDSSYPQVHEVERELPCPHQFTIKTSETTATCIRCNEEIVIAPAEVEL